jgi:hypothetical protein
MKRSFSTLAFAVFVLIAAGTAYAQFTPKRIWMLTVVVNVPGAVIIVDNQQLPANQTRVTGGSHNIQVMADGYFPFSGRVVVNGDMAFPVNLQPVGQANPQAQPMQPAQPNPQAQPIQPAGFPLTINVNVPGAAVFIDGTQVQGVPVVAPGPHSVQVAADGYQNYTASVNVAGPLTLNVVLNPLGYQLTVNSNVAKAVVVVNDVAKGPVPYSEVLPPSTYTVRVSAQGFVDYVATVSLDKPLVINALLRPAIPPSTLSFVVPTSFLDPDMQPNDPQAMVRIFIDGRLANPGREMERIPVEPGRHRIRIASGALNVQLGDMEVRPGVSYVLELGMSVKIRAVKATR